jgi:hypothetical protein
MSCDLWVQRARDAAEAAQRAAELKKKTEALSKAIEAGKVRVKVGPQGAVAFEGWVDRGPITDACAYRRLMSSGSALAKAKIAGAEQAAGVKVNRKVVASGVHSHDGGKTWHEGH